MIWDLWLLLTCLLILAVLGVALVVRAARKTHQPMARTRRLISGREKMADEWRRPAYLPETWK